MVCCYRLPRGCSYWLDVEGPMRSIPGKLLWAACALVLLSFAGCGGDAGTPAPMANDSDRLGPTATAPVVVATGADVSARPTVTSPPSDTPPAAPTSRPADTRVPTSTRTNTPQPPTSTPKPLPPQVLKQGFGQNDRTVGVGLLVANPNPGLALNWANYKITAYDAAGAAVGTAQGPMSLLPGQELGLGALIYLTQQATVTRIDAEVSGGTGLAMEPAPGLSGSASAYLPGDPTARDSARVTGLISNASSRVVAHPLVSAVLYNARGEIIGGGSSRVDFVLPNDRAGVSFYAAAGGTVARVELYGMEESLGLPFVAEPEGVRPPVVLQDGFADGVSRVTFAAIVENPNDGWAMDGGVWHVTAFAADGTVLVAESGVTPLLLPGETLGIAGFLCASDLQPVERIETRVYRAKWTQTEQRPFFVAENVRYVAGQHQGKVTGEIINPYDKELKNVWTYAVCYDQAGAIINGARSSVGPVPAKGRAPAEVLIDSEVVPTRIELYAAVSYLSDLP